MVITCPLLSSVGVMKGQGGQKIYLRVGQVGKPVAGNYNYPIASASGGGQGGINNQDPGPSSGAGGGASSIRTISDAGSSYASPNTTSLNSRLWVAGGGGGTVAYATRQGGIGGACGFAGSIVPGPEGATPALAGDASSGGAAGVGSRELDTPF
ncbi:hypothetical protein P7C70_g4391, partial [Phenoliferia sp. Uapishka_3]